MGSLTRLGLKGRAIAYCVSLLAAAVVLLGAALIAQNYYDAIERTREHALIYARSISQNAEPAILLNDVKAMQRVVESSSSDYSIQNTRIVDTQGQILASFLRNPDFKADIQPDLMHPIAGVITADARLVAQSSDQLLIIVPIWQQPEELGDLPLDIIAGEESNREQKSALLGYVWLNYSLRPILSGLIHRVLIGSIIALAVILVGICATVIMVRHILTPLRELAATATAIADGDFSRRAAEQAVGEVGTLARSFNYMADVLSQYMGNLEHQVRERTAAIQAQKKELENEIAERKRIEDALRASEAQHRGIFEAASDALTILNTDGVVVEANPAACRMYGYSHDELLGMSALKVLHPESYFLFGKFINDVMAGKDFFGESIHMRRDGSRFTVESRGTTCMYNGQLHLLAINRDITERKRAEEAMLQAKEAAEAASQAKSEFLANMSHEIRTPMNGIIGMTELVMGTKLTDEQREYLDIVKSSSASLLRIINDILDFSKIEARKLEFEQSAFSLRDCLEDTIRTHSPAAFDKGVELVCDIAADVPDSLIGDAGRLRQIVNNLVGNAVKFTEQGEVVTRIEKVGETDEMVTLHGRVSDTGIGIASDKQSAIFDAFTQADGSATRKYEGTGLGLTITARLVEMMQGRIWVESEPGTGSCFHFEINLQKDNSETPISTPHVHDLAGLEVLVVDDNSTNRKVLEGLLSRWKMSPHSVEGGPQALQLMGQARDSGSRYPLVLVDAMMPEMDGFTLAQQIKSDPSLADATIMMLSSAGSPGDAARCRELGIAAYLTKPIRQSDLLDAIMLTLGMSGERHPDKLVTRHKVREHRRHLRILLTEDNPVNQKVAGRVLENQGHEITCAVNGREALDLLEARGDDAFDVVLMDVQMPIMGGFEATAEIRRRERDTGCHLPIIAMTAHAMKGDRDRCLEAGMDDYISKPLEVSALYALLEKWAQRTAAAESESEPGASVVADEQQADAEPEPGEEAPADIDRAIEWMGGDRELFTEAVEAFLENVPEKMQKLSEEGRADPERLAALAHDLKGATSILAAEPMRSVAIRLEEMGRQGDLAMIDQVLNDLERQWNRLRDYIEHLDDDD